jgi:cell division protein FtsW
MNEHISDVDRLVKTFLSTLAIIITIGLIMVWSASFILAAEKFGSSLHYIIRQIIFLALACLIAFTVSRTKYNLQ